MGLAPHRHVPAPAVTARWRYYVAGARLPRPLWKLAPCRWRWQEYRSAMRGPLPR